MAAKDNDKMKRTVKTVAIVTITMVALALLMVNARSEPQTRLYDARGNSLGTATPQSDGTVGYRDAGGNSLGTSTTTGNTTTFYGPGGGVTSKTVGPVGNGPFGSGARR
jgi:hypothetical protein